MNEVLRKEQTRQAIDFVYNSVIGFIPGGHLVNEIIDFGAKLHRDRINKFSEMLMYAFKISQGKNLIPNI